MRYATLRLSPLHVLSLYKDKLPPDAKFVRAFVTSGWGYVNLVLESDTFNELKEGDEIPEIQIVIEGE